MQPRTLALIVFVMLCGAVFMRWVIVRFSLLPVSEEAILRRAVTIKLKYTVDGNQNEMVVNDPAEVRELLAALKIVHDDEYYRGGIYNPKAQMHGVTFVFPDFSERQFQWDSPTQLGTCRIDRAFYDKVRALIVRKEGRGIDAITGH